MMKIEKNRKRGFTLLEILICLVVIALAGAVTGTRGKDLIDYHRFRSELHTFLSDLSKFRILSLVGGYDVSCQLVQSPDGYTVFWTPDVPFPSGEETVSYELKTVKKIMLSSKPCREAEILVFSSGRISPGPPLTFVPKREEKAVTIDPAYPACLQEGKGRKIVPSFPPYPLRVKEKKKGADRMQGPS